MSLLATLAYYRTAVFYYVLGGVTFLPLCAATVVVYFWLTAPHAYSPAGRASTAPGRTGDAKESLGELLGSDGELSEERKRKALELVAWNHDAQKEEEVRKERESGDDTAAASVPAAARRVKPAPAQPRRPHRSGWLTVRRHFQVEGVNVALQQAAAAQQSGSKRTTSSTSSNAGHKHQSVADGKGQGYLSTMYRGMLGYRGKNGAGGDTKGTLGVPGQESGRSTPESNAEDNTLSPLPSSAASSPAAAQVSAAKETFYCILKGPILYLYSSADPGSPDTECHAAIDLRNKRVSIYVAGAGDTMGEPEDTASSSQASSLEKSMDASIDSSTASEPDSTAKEDVQTRHQHRSTHIKKARVRDGELFVKRNAIRVVSMGTAGRGAKDTSLRFAQWFVFVKSASQLEDWYHAVLAASMLPEGSSGEGPDLIGPVFSTSDMSNLLGSLDSVPDPIPLRWLNAMFGRIFFSIYKTAWLEDYIKSKFRKKMSRVRTPGFLSDIRIRDVDLGHSPPAFTRPILKSLTGDGEASMEVEMHYTGALRLTISTVLTISLGTRFKQYNVSLVLAVIINSLEGNLLLQIKPPPSNRLWFGFTKLPKMDISVEPVVSERKVQWSMVKRLIEGRIRELLTESLVVPNMDDLPFFDTRSLDHRGGIWADAGKHIHRVDIDTTAPQPAPTGPPTADQGAVAAQSKSTPASVVNMSLGEGDEKTASSSSSVDPKVGKGAPADSRLVDYGLRSRRPLATGGEGSNSDTALLASSPAVAGLSSLLARDQAAGAGSASAIGSQKRRSWFVSGKTNGSKSSSSSVRKSGVQQSSLAWGNASLENRANSGGVGSGPSEAAAIAAHERNKESITSMSSVGTDASADTYETYEGEDGDDVESGRDEQQEALGIDDETSDTGSLALDPPAINVVTDAESLSEQDAEQAQRERSEDTVAEASTPTRGATFGPPPVPTRPTPAQAPANVFAPPPQRSTQPSPTLSTSTGASEQRPSSLAAQSLASIQRDRYGATRAAPADDAQDRAALTSAALLSTWNKAKASMADRETRQATAKEAKDALKRGWASWNTKRAGGGMTTDDASTRASSIVTSSGRMGESSSAVAASRGTEREREQERTARSRTSSWLASSPEDPISLGTGLGLSSSPSALSLEGGATSYLDRGNNGREDASTAASSRASSVSGSRKPYGEHRADKLTRAGVEQISRPSSRTTSIRSSDRPSTPPLPPKRPGQTGMPGTPIESPSTSSGAWDAVAPGLVAPTPVAQRETQQEGRATMQPALPSSPSLVRRLTNSTSGSPQSSARSLGAATEETTASPAYSFLPSQPTPTTGLSNVDLPTLTAPLAASPAGSAKLGVQGELQRRDTSSSDGALQKPTETTAVTASGSVPTADALDDRRASATSVGGGSGTEDATSKQSPPARGIKQQPTRSAMMAVPGIPSMQKAGPQSFEAPSYTPSPRKAAVDDLGSVTTSPRLGIGNLIARMPSFGGASAAGTGDTISAAAPTIGLDPQTTTTQQHASSTLSTGATNVEPTSESAASSEPVAQPSDATAPPAETAVQPADLLGLSIGDMNDEPIEPLAKPAALAANSAPPSDPNLTRSDTAPVPPKVEPQDAVPQE